MLTPLMHMMQDSGTTPLSNVMVYVNYNDGNKLYKKTTTGTDVGTALNSLSSANPNVSPDGLYIYYKNGTNVYKKNATDTDNGSIIGNTGSSLKDVGLTMSPDGLYLVWAKWNGSSWGLYRINNDGTGGAYHGTGVSGYPRYSPDGNYIVGRYIYAVNYIIKAAPAATGGAGSSKSIDHSIDPAVNLNSTKLVYSNDSYGSKMYITDMSEQRGSAVTTGAAHAMTFSPDGTKIAYNNSETGSGSIYITEPTAGFGNGTLLVPGRHPCYAPVL